MPDMFSSERLFLGGIKDFVLRFVETKPGQGMAPMDVDRLELDEHQELWMAKA